MKFRSFNLLVILALFLSLLGSAVTFTPAYAAGIVVNSNADDTLANLNGNGTCDLREAITNANNDDQSGSTECTAGSGTDTITFGASYTITLSNAQLPDIIGGLLITGIGPTSASTIIQASNCDPVNLPGGCTPTANRVFLVSSTGNLTLDMITVRYGYCNGTCPNDLPNRGIGGGILNKGILTIKNSTIANNKTNFSAGGIYSIGSSSLTVLNSTIANNSAQSQGGGMWVDKGSVANSTIVGNTGSIGGGIFKQPIFPGIDQFLTITNSTISGNTIHNNGSMVAIGNSILNNSSCTSSPVNDGGNNLDSGNTCNFTNNALVNTDPLLGSLGDNGGPTQTMALQAGSPAINMGTKCLATDQRGVTRPQGAACDIGAYEAGPVIPVVTASNPSANAVLTSLSSITVVFNQDMLNDGSAKAANNTVNYILVERGANGSFDTTSCNGGVVSDDVQQTISTASYNSAGFVTSLTLASPLTAGTYRLFVCGTTSVWSAAGLELNNGVNDTTVDFTIGAAAGTGRSGNRASTTASSLPTTGFAPNKATSLPAQPATLEYANMGDLWLEIPSLNVKSAIVGVPQNADKTWDVTWLGNDTGWLNGTAFPTWTGNSVLTAHVTNASGLEGPFATLKQLKYGDQIIVHMGGVRYVYEVRNTRLARPYSTSYAFESKQDAAYLTLITCSGYNPLNESYLFRRVVRAVLIEVK